MKSKEKLGKKEKKLAERKTIKRNKRNKNVATFRS